MIAAAWLFVKGLPPWVWVALALLAGGWYYGHTRYESGQANVQGKWDKSVEAGKAEIERLKAESGKVTVRVETKYIDRIKTIKEKGDVIVRNVPVYISRDLPELPGAWRVLHDAAASGEPLPDAAHFANAAGVSPADAATTVAANYATCLANAEQLTGLQEWVREQSALNPSHP